MDVGQKMSRLRSVLAERYAGQSLIDALPRVNYLGLGDERFWVAVFPVELGPQIWELDADYNLARLLTPGEAEPFLEDFDRDWPGWRPLPPE